MQCTKKIAFYLSGLYEGGAENVMVIVANEFAQQNYLVDFVLAKAEGSFLRRLSSKIRIVDLKSPNKYFAIWGLVKYLRFNTPTAILSTLHINNISVVLAKKISRVRDSKTVVRVATIVSEQRRVFWKKWLEKLVLSIIYNQADKVIAVSKKVALDLVSFLKIPSQKVVTIYNPSITPELLINSNKPLNHSWFYPDAPPVVLGVGRLTSDKDYATLVKAFAVSLKELDMRLVMLGDGVERTALELLSKSLGVQEKVQFKGFVENPFNYMRNAKLMVLPSLWEGLPNVLIESLACGCPVISTDSPGGVREILKDGQYGVLVPIGNVQAMAEEILAVLRGHKILPDFHWLDQFKMERSVKQYIDTMLN